jgi:hypothetical protein
MCNFYMENYLKCQNAQILVIIVKLVLISMAILLCSKPF